MSTRPEVPPGELVLVGMSYHTASLEIRELLTGERLGPLVDEHNAVILATCNRSEVYAWRASPGRRSATRLRAALARAAGLSLAAASTHFYVRIGADALLHLVRVAAGLDSLVVGEDQIRGQVRHAHGSARARGPLPVPLQGIFTRAVAAAGRIRSGTSVGRHPSLADAAVSAALCLPELASAGPPGQNARSRRPVASSHSGLRGREAVVVGAGAVAKSAGQALLRAGAHVTLCNRTPEHGRRLAEELGDGTSVVSLSDLPKLLATAAVLVGTSAAPRPIISRLMVEMALDQRADPLVILDLALPRDVDPSVRSLPGVRLIDLDDLERLCPVDVVERRAEIERAERMALEEAVAIGRWLRVQSAVPLITDVRERADEIRRYELRRAARHLEGLSTEQQRVLDRLTRSLVSKLLHGPTLALREAAETGPPAVARVLDVLRLDPARYPRRR